MKKKFDIWTLLIFIGSVGLLVFSIVMAIIDKEIIWKIIWIVFALFFIGLTIRTSFELICEIQSIKENKNKENKIGENMDNRKRRARAIILKEDSIVLMYREFEDRVFYTLPGGGVEGNETLEECVKREVMEEFGIVVEPIKKMYVNEDEKSFSQYFLCKWVSGSIQELKDFSKESSGGKYVPTMVKVDEIPNIPLMPKEIAEKLYNDIKNNKI